MHFHIYGDNPMAFSFAEGMKSRGIDIGAQHFFNPCGFEDKNYRDCDVAVTLGFRPPQQRVCHSHHARGRHTVVIDLGYVNRFQRWDQSPHRYLQVGISPQLGWIPPFPCPDDRLKKLGIKYPGHKTDGDTVLICGQWPADANCIFNDTPSQNKWVAEMTSTIESFGLKAAYRPHPRVEELDIFLEDDLARASVVLTQCSNIGHDALLAGIPVIALSPEAPYKQVAANRLTKETLANPSFPSERQWTDYFSRLAYGQWSLEEFEDGTCADFVLAVIKGEIPPFPETITNVGGNGSTRPTTGETEKTEKPEEAVAPKLPTESLDALPRPALVKVAAEHGVRIRGRMKTQTIIAKIHEARAQ